MKIHVSISAYINGEVKMLVNVGINEKSKIFWVNFSLLWCLYMVKINVEVKRWDLTQKLTQKLTPRDPEKLRHKWRIKWMLTLTEELRVSNEWINACRHQRKSQKYCEWIFMLSSLYMLKNNVEVMRWDLTQKLTQKLTPRDPEKLRHKWRI